MKNIKDTMTFSGKVLLSDFISHKYQNILKNNNLTKEMKIGYIVATCDLNNDTPGNWSIDEKIEFAEHIILESNPFNKNSPQDFIRMFEEENKR